MFKVNENDLRAVTTREEYAVFIDGLIDGCQEFFNKCVIPFVSVADAKALHEALELSRTMMLTWSIDEAKGYFIYGVVREKTKEEVEFEKIAEGMMRKVWSSKNAVAAMDAADEFFKN